MIIYALFWRILNLKLKVTIPVERQGRLLYPEPRTDHSTPYQDISIVKT